jgi:hypothetical protein
MEGKIAMKKPKHTIVSRRKMDSIILGCNKQFDKHKKLYIKGLTIREGFAHIAHYGGNDYTIDKITFSVEHVDNEWKTLAKIIWYPLALTRKCLYTVEADVYDKKWGGFLTKTRHFKNIVDAITYAMKAAVTLKEANDKKEED